jgi:hypothetical protein
MCASGWAIAGDASDPRSKPWSEVSAGFVPSSTAEGHFLPVIVSSIEGDTVESLRVAVAPGKKRMLVDTPRAPGDLAPSHKRIEVELEPCKRYFLAGRRASAVSMRWQPEVIRVEPIEEYVAKFNDPAVTPAKKTAD